MILIFPVETYAREICWRVHFASYLLESIPDALIYICETSKAVDIACRFGSDCVFLGKHIYSVNLTGARDASYYKRLVKSGCHIVFIEEEGGLNLRCSSDFDVPFWQLRCPYDMTGSNSFVTIHWGNYQKQLTHDIFGGSDSNHLIGGAPSIDSCIVSRIACSSKENVRSLPILGIASNGGLGTLFKSIEDYYIHFLGKTKLKLKQEVTSQYLKSEVNMFAELELIHKILDKSQYEFRPHPGLTKYTSSLCEQFSISDSTKIPINMFLQNKKLLIHDGCTTAIQAFFMDIPTISISENINSPVILDDYHSLGERLSIYQLIREKSKLGNLLSQVIPDKYNYLLGNQKDKLNAFDALLYACKSCLYKTKPVKAKAKFVDSYLKMASLRYDLKSASTRASVSKFKSFIKSDVETLINQWISYSTIRNGKTKHAKPYCAILGSLAVKISLSQ